MPSSSSSKALIVVSCRGLSYVRARSSLYTIEDLARQLGVAEVVAAEAPFRNKIHSGVVSRLYRSAPTMAARAVSHRQAAGLAHSPRLLMCQTLADLSLLMPFFDEPRDAPLACFIEEVWESELQDERSPVQLLQRCDAIFVGCRGAVKTLAEATGRPTHLIAPSVDARRFNPFAVTPKERSIALYYMGRRSPELHRGLIDWSAAGGQFYLYDTAGNAVMTDHAEHRLHLADLIQRSEFFIVAPGKSYGNETNGAQQHEVGYRYYEGAAAGAILLGTPNNSDVMREHFDYPDAVFPFDGSPGMLIDLMSLLRREPARVAATRRSGVANALLNHDHAHRWRTILKALGRPEPSALTQRIDELAFDAAALRKAVSSTPLQAYVECQT